ncbi:hypothetical protein FACS189472_12820 [Alphaproteobacteria bacterium]|nr:hypothetical protein FACS189472_12820 [Alphaproteobacteria bacterium]
MTYAYVVNQAIPIVESVNGRSGVVNFEGSESVLVKNTRDGIKFEVHPDILGGLGPGGDSNHAGEGTYSIALGYNSTATGRNGIAIGRGNHVIGDDSSAFGTGSTVNALNSIVLGNGVECTESNQIVIGGIDQNNIIISGSLSVPSIGGSSEGGLPISTVDGKPLLIQPMNYQPKVVIGGNYYGNAGNAPSTNESLKVYGRTTLEGNLNIGASGGDKQLFLNGVEIDGKHAGEGENSIKLGNGGTTVGNDSINIGNSNTVTGHGSFAIGVSNSAIGNQSVSLGNGNVANGSRGIAIGQSNEAAETSSIGIGYRNKANGADSVGIGHNNVVNGESSYAFGYQNTVSSNESVALGVNNVVAGANCVAIGSRSGVSGEQSYVLGYQSVTEADNSIVIGNHISNTEANTIVIGDGNHNTKIPGNLYIGASGGSKQLFLNSLEIKVVNPTSTAQETGETYFGKKVYIKTWEGNVSGIVEVPNFFPTYNSKFVSAGGNVAFNDTTSFPIPYYGASDFKCLLTKGLTSLFVDFASPSSGDPSEVKVWVKYADD